MRSNFHKAQRFLFSMGRIHILSEDVANKIAAGEVVERPASVVKELIENSLDAGATRVRVDIEGGGRKLIQVTDNGCGMVRDDALLAFERHATSKLTHDDDLLSISTLGFRGEALPSIASVCRLRLETRDAAEPSGTSVEIAGGRILTVEEAGLPAGTSISVRDLYFNTPARRKFLKAETTELSHIASLVTHYALAHPEMQWELHSASHAMLTAPPVAGHAERIFQVFGKHKRIDLPALLQAFFRSHSDSFDTAFVWTDFDYDNGLGIAHSFNVRNHIGGIGLRDFDRGSAYGSPSRLSTIITMGNEADWPSDPQSHAAGLNSAISIVCHEQGHRWLAYVRFDGGHGIKDDLLGRENAHWSFLVDTRTNSQGSFSSLMEGNAWRDSGAGTFTTVESAVNYFTPLDQYLMGLRSADEIGEIPYLDTDAQFKEFIREKSPFSGFSMSAVRKTTSVAEIVEREGPRIPASSDAPKDFRIAFILLTEHGSTLSPNTLEKLSRYRDALVRYFSSATGGRASMDASLNE